MTSAIFNLPSVVLLACLLVFAPCISFTAIATFTGNINAVGADKKSVVLIAPTNESDKAAQDKIQDYVELIGDRFYKGQPILTDQEALKRDLSSNAVVVYGTPTGNLWLAKHFCKLPIQIESHRIVAEQVYSGNDLRFITSWPNPENPAKGKWKQVA